MTSNKIKILEGICFAILCFVVGYFVTIGFAFKMREHLGMILAAFAIGSGVCAISAYEFPKQWILWPVLFGWQMYALILMALMDMLPPYNLHHSAMDFITLPLGLLISAIPIMGAYAGRIMKLKKSMPPGSGETHRP
jgi:hypothetical protein